MAILVSDSFDRANNPTSLGTADTGQAWTQLIGVSGSFGINNNNALWTWHFSDPGGPAVHSGLVVLESNLINCLTKITLVDPTTGPQNFAVGQGIVCRLVDVNNLWALIYFKFPGVANQLRLQRTYAGSTTTVIDKSITLADNDTIAVSCCGPLFEIFVNDISQGTYDDSAQPQNYGTKCGLVTESGSFFTTITKRFDDFSVSTVPGCTRGFSETLPPLILDSAGTVAPLPPVPTELTSGNATWMWDTRKDILGWFLYHFSPGVDSIYFEEGDLNMLLGGSDGRLYQYGNANDKDGSSDIHCQIDTFQFDADDPRSNKQFANGSVEVLGTINIHAIADNLTIDLGTTSITSTTRERTTLDFQQGEHRNLMLRYSGIAPLTLYNYSHEYSFVSVSERTELRKAFATSLVFAEYGHLWYIQLCYISSANVVMTVTVDNGSPDTYTFPNSGGTTTKVQQILKAIKGRLHEVQFTSAEDFQIIRDQTVLYAKEFRSSGPYEVAKSFGDDSRSS